VKHVMNSASEGHPSAIPVTLLQGPE